MNIKIYSQASFQMMVPNYLYQAYEEGKRSIDFLLLFPVSRSDSEHILATIKKCPVVLDAKWRFGTVTVTAYIRH
ncbi:hypothetical protein ABVB09_01575 [Streptococcus dysgalactiae subsp. equisimilis]|uniref:Uncharacterized protein n=1 Tax=Streptococcus pyogenes TaxID=1314 RepID=A0A660A8G7_STRPY|nr:MULTISPECIES: hypothetical protein [Streptococcus]MCY7196066.1 hypothetical protein [Streptococcus dysgalactiae]MCY7200537.1 hypothetical protein [Streptococcus dysgalactiae]MCY7205568.1 hypothetical protein [Streptococcus dysgalactiae]MCY7216213.1 hypothetical protein [Streptococcus dysgalactiae]ORJ91940.1 hypothetical protein B7O95_00115 [Streptococcus dysgalactiae subsp. equisimilis]